MAWNSPRTTEHLFILEESKVSNFSLFYFCSKKQVIFVKAKRKYYIDKYRSYAVNLKYGKIPVCENKFCKKDLNPNDLLAGLL